MSLLLNVVTYQREFVALGGVNVAVYLSNLIWNADRWQEANGQYAADGWMDAHISEMEKITGLSPREQMFARICLRGQGILEQTQSERLEPVIRINLEVLARAIGGES